MRQDVLREQFDYSTGSTTRENALWQGLLHPMRRRKGAKPAHRHCIKDGVFIDNGYSGLSPERPGLRSLMRDIEAGKVRHIIALDASRFFRDIPQTFRFLDFCDSHDVTVTTVADFPRDPRDLSDEFLAEIIGCCKRRKAGAVR